MAVVITYITIMLHIAVISTIAVITLNPIFNKKGVK